MSGGASSVTRLVVYGAGDHGRVVAEAAEAAGFIVAGLIDDALAAGQRVAGRTVLANDEETLDGAAVIVGIGDNTARRTVAHRLAREGRTLQSVIHPTASVSRSAHVAEGVFVGPQAVVHSEASIERGAIINSGAIVEHHNRIGAFSHIAPGAVMGGRCDIGETALVGLGARVLPARAVGDGATVAAGAVAHRDVASHQTVAGVPAKPK